MTVKFAGQPEITGGVASATVIVDEQVEVHPNASVTVNVCKPAPNPAIVPVPVYGAVPPETVTLIDPSLAPTQVALLTILHDAVMAGETFTTPVDADAVQPFPFPVTVTI